MHEIEEVRLRKIFFYAIMDFFDEREEMGTDPNEVLDFSDFAHDLTDKLIDAYAINKGVDTNRTNREESI